MLFIRHDQAKIGEFHVLPDQSVCADHDVDLSFGQLPFHQILFRFLLTAGQKPYADAECFKQTLEFLIMLFGQKLRRRHEGALTPVPDGLIQNSCRDRGFP